MLPTDASGGSIFAEMKLQASIHFGPNTPAGGSCVSTDTPHPAVTRKRRVRALDGPENGPLFRSRP